MTLTIPDLLPPDVARDLKDRILAADWIDGNATSGGGSAIAKHNRQLPEDCAAARTVQTLTGDRGADDAEVLRLTCVYHNLMRRFATP